MGNTPIYLANVLLKVEAGSKLTEDKEYGIQGFINNLHIVKSRTNRAGQIIELIYDQEKGVDNIYTSYHHLKKEGLIKGAGRSFYLETCPDVKFSQKDFKKKLKDSPELRKAFATTLKESLMTYINKDYDVNVSDEEIDIEE